MIQMTLDFSSETLENRKPFSCADRKEFFIQ